MWWQVYAMKEGGDWCRKDVVIEDNERNRIRVKLWNEKVKLELEQGQNVVIENVETDVYNNVVSVNSTVLTNVVSIWHSLVRNIVIHDSVKK